MKRLMFRTTLRILRDRMTLEHAAAEIAVGLLGLGLLGAAVVVGQATIIEKPDTVSGTGKVAIQGNAAIIEAPFTVSGTGTVTSAPSARAASN